MSRNRRQLAFLVPMIVSLIVPSSAVCAEQKRTRSLSNDQQRVVSVTQDLGGNFVLLSLDRPRQLQMPAINYLPGPDGSAIMAVDFPGALLAAQTPSFFQFPGTAIKQLHIGQLQTNPPVMRATFVAQNAGAFKRIEFRSSPGTLAIHIPDSSYAFGGPSRATHSVAPATAGPIPAPERTTSIPAPAPERTASVPVAAGPCAAGQARAVAVSTPPTTPTVPALRGPIDLPQLPDAQYISVSQEKTEVKPAAPKATAPAKPAPAANPKAVVPKAAPPIVAAQPVAAPKPAPDIAAKPTADVAPKPAPELASAPARSGIKRFWKKFFETSEETKDSGSSEGKSAETARRDMVPPLREGTEPRRETARAAKPVATEKLQPICVAVTTNPVSVLVTTPANSTAKTFRLHDPERYVVDINAADNKTTLPPLPEEAARYIKSIRVGSPEGNPNIARVVLDLASADVPIEIEQFNPTKNNAGETTFALRFTGDAPTAPSVAEHVKTPPPGSFVVLDAGHGGSDPGAQRGDIQEKELTMQITERLRKELQGKGVKVKLTRSDDSFVSLEDRVKITNDLHPDAFLSVHINSLETNAATTGIETYYQTENSRDLAQLIHTSLVKTLGAPDRGVRKARFYVINHTPVPAILAEVGFISNKEEREKLASSDYQAQIADALSEGVMLYLSEHRTTAASPAQPADPRPEIGTISALPASPSPQSFTQNLQRRSKPKPQLGRQSLKFKKSRVAATRS